MTTCHAIALALVALLTPGIAHAQDNSEASGSGATPRTACLIDDHLSVWLSLEAADRMVALLEKERGELSARLAKHGATLKLMEEGKVIRKGVMLTKTGVPRTIEPGGREALEETCDRTQTRLIEVSKTLERRRLQRAVLEEWLNVYQGARAAGGS